MLNKTNQYLTPIAICLLTLSACDSNDSLSVDNQGKTPIELTVGIVGENPTGDRAQTRTVVTTDIPYGQSASAFGANTSLYMVIKGDKDGSASKYTRSIGTVTSGSQAVSFADGYERYWEDSYSRDSKLSVYSACVPALNTALTIGGSNTYNPSSYDWSTTAISPTIDWPLTGVTGTFASQDATFLTNQDLCFSNNVSNISSDNRMVFDTDTKKFVVRQMIFHHALTRITFKIKRGDGFGTGSGVFNFNSASENIVLKGFNTSGTLDMSTGEFSSSSIGTADISLLANTRDATADAEYDYVLTGMMLPGSALTSTATDEVYFTIDNNKYHITKAQLATALASKKLTDNSTAALADGSKMRPGVHYVFTMTVSKKKIDKLSAAIVDWETVSATATPSNARITVSLMNNGTLQTGDANFNLYRKASVSTAISDTFEDYDWATGYTDNKANLTENTTNEGVYTAHNSTDDNIWYWPDNKTYYHFRAVMPKDHPVNTAANDYITLTGAASYTDVCWGAPFKSINVANGDRLTYSLTTGFDNTGTGETPTHQIYKAIGPTSDPVQMELFHMMSDVTIQLTTTNDDDKVTLAGATIQLSMIHPTGKVSMGNGLVTPDGAPATVEGTVDGDYKWHYGFVPQPLENVSAGSDVILTITTADNNRYIVYMKNVEFSSTAFSNTLIANPYSETSPGSGKYKINRWYPNFKYTYTFNLRKKGVALITATLANWESVTAYQQDVYIQ